jgi:hypothetical protein
MSSQKVAGCKAGALSHQKSERMEIKIWENYNYVLLKLKIKLSVGACLLVQVKFNDALS